ncbi:MAG TPA: ATP-binding cassette domain-containing protein [Gemmatimonadaceae bacterium]|nr:ATP-binding cassette domain-containing protein [Gemmatimonadaceae bacterium]
MRYTDLRRGRRVVLAGGELALPPGVVVALVGANGAGKSTLLMALARVLAPCGGTAEAWRDGGPVRQLGYVPQRPAFPSWLPLGQALALHGAPPAVVAVLGLASADGARLLARPASALSPGQTQALATAVALARDDPLVLLDEPFAGVDLARREALRALVAARRARQPDAVLILSSHVAADLDALCDWVVALREGRCVFQGPRDALPSAPGREDGGTLEARLAALTG